MTKQTIKGVIETIDECGDKVAVLRTLFKHMRNDHPDAAFVKGLEKICSEVGEGLSRSMEVLGDTTVSLR
jgi:hypothetical protein